MTILEDWRSALAGVEGDNHLNIHPRGGCPDPEMPAKGHLVQHWIFTAKVLNGLARFEDMSDSEDAAVDTSSAKRTGGPDEL